MNDSHTKLNPKIKAYLDRIDYNGLLDGSADTLANLQECHLKAVPYENIDILQEIPLSLEIDDLFDKVVNRHRGGYCFELNAIFRWLLEELDYQVTSLMARFWKDEPNPPPKRRHHVLKVAAENTNYLCDVGVGVPIPLRPIKMEECLEQKINGQSYKLERTGDPYVGWMLFELKEGEWCRLYSFTEEPQYQKDFIMATYWCENASDSIFINDAMVAIRTDEGRNTIDGKKFKLFRTDGVKTFTPQTKKEYKDALKKYFGIDLEINWLD